MTNQVRQVTLGLRLRAARVEAGISLDQAAEQVKLTRQAVSKWEEGRTAISAVQLGRLATLYGKSTDFLLFGIRTVPVLDVSDCSQCMNARGIMQLSLGRK